MDLERSPPLSASHTNPRHAFEELVCTLVPGTIRRAAQNLQCDHLTNCEPAVKQCCAEPGLDLRSSPLTTSNSSHIFPAVQSRGPVFIRLGQQRRGDHEVGRGAVAGDGHVPEN